MTRIHHSQQVTVRDFYVEVSLHLRICDEFKIWIRGFGSEAKVMKPASLRRECT